MKMIYGVTIYREHEVEIPDDLAFTYLKDEDDYTEEEMEMCYSGKVRARIADLIREQLAENEAMTSDDDFEAICEV